LSPRTVFDLVTDYGSYPDFLAEVNGCRVIGESGGKKMVEYQISVIKNFKYVNEHTEQKPNLVAWKFVKGDLFKSMSGHWRLSEENGKTRAEYFVEASFGLLVPKAMTQKALSVNLPAMMKAYHKRVAQLFPKGNHG
jgi:coenzyme Q-binding protein COQ10